MTGATGNDRFYADLPLLEDFDGVSDFSAYHALPDNWWVIAADVRDSTGAIRAGAYKAVNITGVSVISAILNLARPLELPYVFGGDGATLCIPGRLCEPARTALAATRAMARREFDLDLRVGLVPVHELREAGHPVLVARHRMSRYFVQAAFAGGGVELAEQLIKQSATWRLENDTDPGGADFQGLECRWEAVPSRHGETIALIVKATATSLEAMAACYDSIIRDIQRIYGDDENCRPVHVEGLRTTWSPRRLRFETGVRTAGRGPAARLGHLARILVQNVIGWVLMTFRITAGGVPWGNYKPDLVLNTDFKKFDGVLRAVLSGTPAQREALESVLSPRMARGECVYGIHASKSALITCLINKRDGEHFHFVDGDDGGYALAAAGLKARLAERSGGRC